ncbi:type II 3-dehydroquinate dehydratase [Aeromicrobium endophyticum]|uniref:3-dehydroquinate dehydratase n=1 Tax=Aeromicrobium endophyticum TaxID=2292704 RepID=A0A371P4R1_9ACTN|nr:type II 3-dehydroquinate dehydratase [Aeromicrobium endophyticum]REK70921.1 type II 3-dehydroquinate dehydratase [Aeromicrobium endophyticum]
MSTVLLVNGPNLNLLGVREPAIYGRDTLQDVEDLVRSTAGELGLSVDAVQSNHEGVLVDAIHAARDTCSAIVINPGAFSHTSVAIRDALAGVDLPVAEVHVTNIHRREPFRHHSYVSGIAELVVVGAGVRGYELALRGLADIISAR